MTDRENQPEPSEPNLPTEPSLEPTEPIPESPESADSTAPIPVPESAGSALEDGSPVADSEAAADEEIVPPSFVFFGVVAAVSLVLDVTSKAWAVTELRRLTLLGEESVLVKNHLEFSLAFNRGGAWGLFQDASEAVRKPFFLIVSMAALIFIVSLYHRIHPSQRALRWGLPLVLGGALGNLVDRIVRGSVVDFIDYRADWVRLMNEGIAALANLASRNWHVTEHWPTFNVADISICVGVGLMAIDMITSSRGPDAATGGV